MLVEFEFAHLNEFHTSKTLNLQVFHSIGTACSLHDKLGESQSHRTKLNADLHYSDLASFSEHHGMRSVNEILGVRIWVSLCRNHNELQKHTLRSLDLDAMR